MTPFLHSHVSISVHAYFLCHGYMHGIPLSTMHMASPCYYVIILSLMLPRQLVHTHTDNGFFLCILLSPFQHYTMSHILYYHHVNTTLQCNVTYTTIAMSTLHYNVMSHILLSPCQHYTMMLCYMHDYHHVNTTLQCHVTYTTITMSTLH